MSHNVAFKELLGKYISRAEVDDFEVYFYLGRDGLSFYKLYHFQDCCENVYVEDVCGDVKDICGIITEAEEVTSGENIKDGDISATWTFYKIGTQKGSITIRFYGESNGYYSESVDCEFVDNGYGSIRGRMLNYLSRNPDRGGVSVEHHQLSDIELLECYTEAVRSENKPKENPCEPF